MILDVPARPSEDVEQRVSVGFLERLLGPPKLSRDDFAREIERQLVRSGHKVQLDVDTLTIAVDGAPPADLGPRWRSYERAPRAERWGVIVATLGTFCVLDSFWVAKWVEVKTTDASAVADALGLTTDESPLRFTDALVAATGTSVALVTQGSWTFVFTPTDSDLASRRVGALSRRFGEAHAIFMDEKHGIVAADFYRDGERVRRIEKDSGVGPIPLLQEGVPIPGEPVLTNKVTSWEGLALAISAAWGACAGDLLKTQPTAKAARAPA